MVKGDSLWKIAKKNGVTVKAIEAANPGIDPARLKVGQKLSSRRNQCGRLGDRHDRFIEHRWR